MADWYTEAIRGVAKVGAASDRMSWANAETGDFTVDRGTRVFNFGSGSASATVTKDNTTLPDALGAGGLLGFLKAHPVLAAVAVVVGVKLYQKFKG
jgi:hypothetical protein